MFSAGVKNVFWGPIGVPRTTKPPNKFGVNNKFVLMTYSLINHFSYFVLLNLKFQTFFPIFFVVGPLSSVGPVPSTRGTGENIPIASSLVDGLMPVGVLLPSYKHDMNVNH